MSVEAIENHDEIPFTSFKDLVDQTLIDIAALYGRTPHEQFVINMEALGHRPLPEHMPALQHLGHWVSGLCRAQ